MVNLGAIDVISPDNGVEAVAFGEPVREAIALGVVERAGGAIAADEVRRGGWVAEAVAAIAYSTFNVVTLHGGMEIGQVEDLAREEDSAAVAGIQAEEVDAGDTIHGDVGAHVHLDKLREARDGGETTRMHVAHAKGDNTDPALPFKDIEGQDGWNEGAQRCGREGPVGEEQLVPGLRHDPCPGGRWVGAMSGLLQKSIPVHNNPPDFL